MTERQLARHLGVTDLVFRRGARCLDEVRRGVVSGQLVLEDVERVDRGGRRCTESAP
jgi:hypothetical protein